MKVQKLKDNVIGAKRALNEALQAQASAKSRVAALLQEQMAAGTVGSEAGKAAVSAARVDGEKADAAVNAARELLQAHEEALHAEEARLEAETAEVVRSVGAVAGRTAVTVGSPNAAADARKGFRSSREFLLAAMNASGLRSRDQVKDDRLRLLATSDGEDKASGGELVFMLPVGFTPTSLQFQAAAGSDEQGEYDDRYGGFAMQTTRLPGLLQIGFEGDPTAGLTQPIPMQTPSVEIVARTDKNHTSSVSGGFTVARRAETVAASSSRAAIEMVTLKAAALFGLSYATEEMLADSPLSFVAIIDQGFRTQFAAHMLNEKLRGLGGNQFSGVLAGSDVAPCVVSVAKESSQPADTINATNIIKMAARCWGYGSGVWLANHDTRPQLITCAIVYGTGSAVPIYTPSAQLGFPDMLLGRPVYYTEFASAIGDLGDIILGNWSQYLEGVYQPLQSAESVHVRFVNHERTFKFWLRNAGGPWWRSALTPNKSSSTLSPFVTLDAR